MIHVDEKAVNKSDIIFTDIIGAGMTTGANPKF